jgi:O-antigen ligase
MRFRPLIVHSLPHAAAMSARILTAGLVAVFTAVVVVLAQSAFWSGRASLPVATGLATLAVLSFLRPRDGLLVVAALAPFGLVGTPLLGSGLRGAEALVLAFLAGALVRGWWTGRLRRFPANGLEVAALLFGIVVAASCLEQLGVLQFQRDFAWPFAREAAAYAATQYTETFAGYSAIYHAMLLLEGVALLCCAAIFSRHGPYARSLIRALLLAAVGAAMLSLAQFGSAVWRDGPLAEALFSALRLRWTAHIGDVNAAGSYFLLATAAAIGMGMAAASRRAAAGWLAGGVLLAAACWLSGSRASRVAGLTLLVVTLGRLVLAGGLPPLRRRRLVAVTVAAMAAASLLIYYAPARLSAPETLARRAEFHEASLRMWATRPAFGVGIGQYYSLSADFFSPELQERYPRENAHNYFLQIATELGVAGIATFAVLLGAAFGPLWRRLRSSDVGPVLAGMALGLAGFVVTWLTGHPLLVPEVAYPFWLFLGVAAALAATSAAWTGGGAPPSRTWLVLGVVVLLGASLPVRVARVVDQLDMTGVVYGLHDWEIDETDTNFRWTSGRARVFIPPDALEVELPLRAILVGPNRDGLDVRLCVDGRPCTAVRYSDEAWHRHRLSLPPPAPGAGHRRIDLRVRQPWVPAEAIDGSDDTRELGAMLGALRVVSR